MDSVASARNSPVLLMQEVAAGSLQDPSAPVLSGINWSVNGGDFWVLAGLQGSGKSDLLMMTAGLTAPLGGRYYLFGQEMPILDEERLPERLRLGLVFESGQLFNHLTVAENLGLPLRYHRNLTKEQAAPVVRHMLQTMELEPWADSTPGALGTNWHKRVGLARALMLQPEVLLVDNALSGLDLRHMSWWLNLLGQLAGPRNFLRPEPITLVVTSADLRPWLGRARQFALLKNQQLNVIGDRARLETSNDELVGELLARPRALT